MSGTPWTNLYPDAPSGSSTSTSSTDGATNAAYPGMPAGATPVHRTLSVALAGTADVYSPPAGKRLVVASAFISSDTAMRIALVDDTDDPPHRIAVQHAGVNGGSSPNLVPVPYPQENTGRPIRLVTGAAGAVDVRVSGWLAD